MWYNSQSGWYFGTTSVERRKCQWRRLNFALYLFRRVALLLQQVRLSFRLCSILKIKKSACKRKKSKWTKYRTNRASDLKYQSLIFLCKNYNDFSFSSQDNQKTASRWRDYFFDYKFSERTLTYLPPWSKMNWSELVWTDVNKFFK